MPSHVSLRLLYLPADVIGDLLQLVAQRMGPLSRYQSFALALMLPGVSCVLMT